MEERTSVTLNQKHSNVILVVIWVALFFGGFSLFKLMPTVALIMKEFGIGYAQTGVMNTAGNWASLILMAPMGFIARKYPPKWTITVTMAIMGLAGLITANAGSFGLFMVGRILEGGAQALTVMVGYSLAVNLAGKHRALIMSAMVSASMLAQFALLNVGSRILASGATWRNLYTGIAVAQLIIMVIWAIICPKTVKISGKGPVAKPTKEQTLRVFKSASLWFASIGNGVFLAAIVGTSTYIPTYMTTRGLDMVKASSIFSIASLLGIFASIIFGVLSDKLHTKRKIAAFSSFSALLCFVLLMVLPVNALILFSVLYGLLPRSIVGMATSIAPDVVENSSDVPVANSMREIISRFLSITLGILVGVVLESFGYTVLFIALSVVMVIAGFLWLAAKKIP